MKVNFLYLDRLHDSLRYEIIETIKDCIDNNKFILGEEVENFEEEFAAFNGVKHCVGLSSGLSSLEIALRALKIGEGDQVIVPANTFIATALAVSKVGAKPVFVDCDKRTFEIDPYKIEEKITSKTRAIMPVHLYGNSVEMSVIMNIAKRNGLFVIEDSSQSHGVLYRGSKCGSIGAIGCFSCYPSKNFGALSDAGCLITNDGRIADFAKIYRNYGQIKKYEHKMEGSNDRLDAIQAAILRIKLKHLNDWNERRRQIARIYINELSYLDKVLKMQKITHECVPVYHLFEIICETERGRNGLAAYLAKNGIQTGLHYPKPIHLQEAYKKLNYKDGDFPIAEKLAKTMLSLPMCPMLKNEEVYYVCDKIKEFYNEHT